MVSDAEVLAGLAGLSPVRVYEPDGGGGRVLCGVDDGSFAVAWRGSGGDTGTETAWNVQDDLFAHKVGLVTVGRAHAGFVRHHASMARFVEACRIEWAPAGDVLETGFSLGAACALLDAWRLAGEGASVRAITFGGPRVFDRAAALAYMEAVPHTRRVIVPGDSVPKLPPSALGFRHVEGLLRLPGNRRIADHDRAVYRDAIIRMSS